MRIDGFEDVPQDEASLMKAASQHPIAVGICAGAAMQFYSSGVISTCCEGLNHGVLVAGYGTEQDGSRWWLIKNSWGGAWGEKGYFRLRMGLGDKEGDKAGLCGVASSASYPVKTFPNPTTVPEVCDSFAWTECPAGNSCSCSFSFFGLFCIWHDCCPLRDGVTCSDLAHCCPPGSTCNNAKGVCLAMDGTEVANWYDKTKASVLAQPLSKPIHAPATTASRKAGGAWAAEPSSAVHPQGTANAPGNREAVAQSEPSIGKGNGMGVGRAAMVESDPKTGKAPEPGFVARVAETERAELVAAADPDDVARSAQQ